MREGRGSHICCGATCSRSQYTTGLAENLIPFATSSRQADSTFSYLGCSLVQVNIIDSKAGYQMEMALPGVSAGIARVPTGGCTMLKHATS